MKNADQMRLEMLGISY